MQIPPLGNTMHLLMNGMTREIHAMARHSRHGPEGDFTDAGTQYVSFSEGRRIEEGAPISYLRGTPEELVAATLDAVRAYREEFPAPVDLVWRLGPELRLDHARGRPNIFLRLAFEAIVEESSTTATGDLTELRPPPTTGIVAMLTEMLRRAKAGEIAQLALVCVDAGGNGYSTWISDREADTMGPHASLVLIGAIADLQFTALQIHNERQ